MLNGVPDVDVACTDGVVSTFFPQDIYAAILS